MHRRDCLRNFVAAACGGLAGVAAADDGDALRKELRSLAVETLEQLYWLEPRARAALEAAEGYAVFRNFGVKLMMGGSGSGRGIAIERATRRHTFMKMFELQAGLGLSVRKYRQVWVFERTADLADFVGAGWEFSGQSVASAQLAGRGGELHSGSLAIRPGVWLYQMNDDGLALDLTLKGARYYPDKKLN